ncbi:hypothetical protein [Nocardia sp. R6R-6]|uniref:hypothetical protein n=1 Tax=Nocardia sp. R6R-6 TaxID=3459303 RepID=UPI00403E2610
MRAGAYHGARDVRIEKVEDPRIEHAGDVIVKTITTSMCGSETLDELPSAAAPFADRKNGFSKVVIRP